MQIQKDIVLAPYTTFHIGGPADYFVVAQSTNEIIEAVQFAKEKGIPFFILGQGANILVGDKGYRGLVIANRANKFQISNNPSLRATEGSAAISEIASSQAPRNDDSSVLLTAESGATIQDLIAFATEQGLSGFEHFAGIPSSVGGALWQNLHFLNPERTETVFIGNILESAEILPSSSPKVDPSGRFNLTQKTVNKEFFHFSYDYSILHDSHDVILTATFRLTKKPKEEIQKIVDANIAWRKEKHPKDAEHKSAGSVFKKIEHHGAGRLIEQVGLKGHKIGGAQISDTHANFIINTGDAKASDVMQLIALIQTKIKDQLGLDMTPEISFVGEF